LRRSLQVVLGPGIGVVERACGYAVRGFFPVDFDPVAGGIPGHVSQVAFPGEPPDAGRAFANPDVVFSHVGQVAHPDRDVCSHVGQVLHPRVGWQGEDHTEADIVDAAGGDVTEAPGCPTVPAVGVPGTATQNTQ